MSRNLRQNVVILIVVLSFFALSFATSVESAQTSRNRVKAMPTPPAKKSSAKTTPTPSKKTTAKTTPTPGKKTQAKATPTTTPKKSSTSNAKTKAADKKSTTAKSSAAKETSKDKNSKDKNSKDKNSKDKTASKTKETPSKQLASSKSNPKSTDKKTAGSKSAKSEPKPPSKNSKSAATKTLKPVTTTAKNLSSPNKTTPVKTPVKENTSSKTTTKTPVKAPEKVSNEAPQIIVTDISARIRSQAKPSAPEIIRAKLGTILQVAEKTPAWYRVQFPSGGKTSSGWISANSVNDLNSAGRDQIYRQIAERYYKGEGMDFATASELYEFLTRAVADLGNSSSAEIELKRLLALRSALKAIPAGKSEQNPYREFLKAHAKNVVYSEPSAQWLVSSNLFWDLHKKYEKSPLADQIAWEGAQNPLPGECEGYVNCHLFYARMTSGEYLSLHPNGRKSLEALTNLTNFLEPIAASLTDKSVYTGPTDVTDRAEFNNLIAELRTIVSRLPLTEKEKPLQQLKKIAEGFR